MEKNYLPIQNNLLIQPMYKNETSKGYIVLLTIIIVSAIGVVLSTTFLLIGTIMSQTSSLLAASVETRALVQACAEASLEKVHDVNSFTGTITVSFADGTCSYTITATTSVSRTITIQGSVGAAVRKNTIVLSAISPQIHISSWQETP